MIEQKKINIWIDKDLAEVFKKNNNKFNKLLFEYQLVSFFFKYNISYCRPYEALHINQESFSNSEIMAKTICKIIIRMQYISDSMKKLINHLSFLESYL